MESPDKREEVELQRRIAASLGSTVRLETTFFPNQLGQHVTLHFGGWVEEIQGRYKAGLSTSRNISNKYQVG